MNKLFLLLLFIISPLLSSTSVTNGLVIITIIVLAHLYSNRQSFGYNIDHSINKLFAAKFVWMAISILLVDINTTCFIRVFQFVGCVLAFHVAATVSWRISDIRFVKNTLAIVVISILGYTFATGTFTNNSFIFNNANVFAGMMLCWSVPFVLDKNKISLLILPLIFFLIFTTSARTDLVCFVLFLGLIGLQSKKPYFSKYMNLLLWCEIGMMAAFVIIYPMLLEYDFGQAIDQYSQEYTGKQLMSGRNQIWLLLFGSIIQSPVIGWGLSAVPDTLYGIALSSHNMFLQEALQEGLVGLLLLLVILARISYCLLKRQQSQHTIISLSFMFLIILHECFEISLTQNIMFIGLMMWFVLGIGFNKKLDLDYE